MEGRDEGGNVRIVDGYRRDMSRRFAAAMVPGLLVALLGSILIGLGAGPLVRRDPERLFQGRPTFQAYHAPGDDTPHYITTRERTLIASGALLCLLSPFVLGFGLRRLLDVDDFLILRTDGLVHQRDGRAQLFLWDEVEEVRWDARRAVIALVLREGGEFLIRERYAGPPPEELARRLADCRRKAIWNLLPAQRT